MDAKLEEGSGETGTRAFGQGEEPAVKRRVQHYGDRLGAQHQRLDEFFATVFSCCLSRVVRPALEESAHPRLLRFQESPHAFASAWGVPA